MRVNLHINSVDLGYEVINSYINIPYIVVYLLTDSSTLL